MPDLAYQQRIDAETILAAFHTADTDGEAALNGLLYTAGALLMSAVLLITTSPVPLAVALAAVPWMMLAVGLWLWLAPAVQARLAAARAQQLHEHRARQAAVAVLLEEATDDADRRVAARYLLADLDAADRARTARRLLRRGTGQSS